MKRLFDLHNDVPSLIFRKHSEGHRVDIDKIMLEEYHAERLCGVIFSIFVANALVNAGKAEENALEQLFLSQEALERSRLFEACTDSASIDKVRSKGKIPVLFSLEGAEPITKLEKLSLFKKEGVGIIGLTWSRDNKYAGGCRLSEKSCGSGLTPLGKELLKEAERNDFIVDLAHSSDKTALDILDTYGGRVIITHTNCRSLNPIERNASDEILKGVSKRGGIVGMSGVSMLCGGDIEKMSEHILHALNACGNKYVCMGLDISDSRIESKKNDTYEYDGKAIQTFDILSSYGEIDCLEAVLCENGVNNDCVNGIFSENAFDFFIR